MNQQQRREILIEALLKERGACHEIEIPKSPEEQKVLLRGLMNIRLPKEIDKNFLKIQDAYLQEEIKQKGITDANELVPIRDGFYLWQGDITTLRCDAIVNAANSGLTGCYIPNHRCIDNCIHSFAGIELRLACDKLIKAQGYEEPVGQAKITPAYNLPCDYILHTVGPIVVGNLTEDDCRLLNSCYRSCLQLAQQKGLESIAFCCISTGEFHFPQEKAAEIAFSAVKEFMRTKTSIKKVIFNVFKDSDREIYRSVLAEN